MQAEALKLPVVDRCNYPGEAGLIGYKWARRTPLCFKGLDQKSTFQVCAYFVSSNRWFSSASHVRTATVLERLTKNERGKYRRHLKRMVAHEESDLKYARDFLLSLKAAMIVTGSHITSSWAMKDPLLKRFLASGYTGAINDDTISRGFLNPDFELLDSIGHWVCTDKIMKLYSSCALKTAKKEYRYFSNNNPGTDPYFRLWDSERLLHPGQSPKPANRKLLKNEIPSVGPELLIKTRN